MLATVLKIKLITSQKLHKSYNNSIIFKKKDANENHFRLLISSP